MRTEAAWLLAGLMTVHFIGDFTVLATSRMQESKASGEALRWIGAHAAVHGGLAAILLMALVGPMNALPGIATIGVSHFTIDTVRARLGVHFPVLGDPSRKPFWTSLGLDQLLHGLVLVWVALQVA